MGYTQLQLIHTHVTGVSCTSHATHTHSHAHTHTHVCIAEIIRSGAKVRCKHHFRWTPTSQTCVVAEPCHTQTHTHKHTHSAEPMRIRHKTHFYVQQDSPYIHKHISRRATRPLSTSLSKHASLSSGTGSSICSMCTPTSGHSNCSSRANSSANVTDLCVCVR